LVIERHDEAVTVEGPSSRKRQPAIHPATAAANSQSPRSLNQQINKSPNQQILDPEFLRKLERLRIRARRAFPGLTRGERRSTRKGSSVEFSDFRQYQLGDDFRHIDWNIYARLERLMLRRFIEEEDLRIDLLIDCSGSMHFGEPLSKLDYARKAAAALAFLANDSHDRVGVAAFDGAIVSRLRAMRGQGHLLSILSFLNSVGNGDTAAATAPAGTVDLDSAAHGAANGIRSDRRGGKTDLTGALRAYLKSNSRPGIVFILSDFLDDGDFRRQLRLLVHEGYDVNLIQVLSPDEMEPDVMGDLMLIDSETGERCEISEGPGEIEAYKTALRGFTSDLESFSRTARIGYELVTTDQPLEGLLFKNLIEARMLE
jgi:hypothetical protein